MKNRNVKQVRLRGVNNGRERVNEDNKEWSAWSMHFLYMCA
jgi:hypothetical protein